MPPSPDHQRQVLDAVWSWLDSGVDAKRREVAQRVRRSQMQALVMAVVALVLVKWLDHRLAGYIVLGLAIVVMISGRQLPAVFRQIERAQHALTHVVTHAFTWILLTPFFYLCFGGGHLILWLRRRDPLARAWERDQPSYWRSPPPRADYHRQF